MTMRTRRSTRGLLSGALVIAVLLGSGSAPAKEAEPDFVWLTHVPLTLDPALGTGQVERRVIESLYEGLVRLEGERLQPVAAAASSWRISDDGRRYTFKLRPEARWSNGDRVLASHFIDAWKRVLDPATGSEWAYLLDPIRHARTLRAHPGSIERLRAEGGAEAELRTLEAELADARAHVGVDQGFFAPDERTVVVELSTYAPYVLHILAHPVCSPVHPRLKILSPSDDRGFREPWRNGPPVIGNGPYVLRAFTAKRLRLARSTTYWDRAAVGLEHVEARFDESPTERLRRYEGGEGHWLPAPPTDADRHDHAYTEPQFITYFVRLNTRRKAFRDARVRRALAAAIDRAAIVKDVVRGTPTRWLVPPGVPGYAEGTASSGAPDRAAALGLLREAGRPDADKDGRIDDALTLTYLYNTSRSNKAIAEALAKQLEAVGVTLDLVHNEWFMYLDRVRGGGYDLARGGWIGDYLDPRTFLAMFRTDDPDNQTGWSSARYDALLQLADDPAGLANAPTRWAKLYEDAVDGTRLRDALKDVRAAGNARLKRRALSELRMALLYEAEALLIEGAPIIPLYNYRGHGLLRPGVSGFHPNVLSHHPIRELRRN